MRTTVFGVCVAGLFLAFVVMTVGRIMERIERTRIRMGGNPARCGGKVITAGAVLFLPCLAGVLVCVYVWK